ncbi:prepilin-type N-terminal cleavage/methylation domain-containing protein [Candidatus Saccharibacteria bacterium]|nr:prepilin-type N-terminal cleavage/methylation domain-containing protein [Candidatus Saccharibacteria bacterium]
MKTLDKQSGGVNLNNSEKSAGFTIIELLLATIIFSVVLVVILAAFLQIGRLLYKGISYASTSQAARSITENIADDIRFAQQVSCIDQNGVLPACQVSSNTYYFCIGLHRYSFTLREKVTDFGNPSSLKGVKRTTIIGGCPSPAVAAGSDPQQLLGPDMQLNKFDIECAYERCNIELHIIYYGFDTEVFASTANPDNPAAAINDPEPYCTGGLISSQFCATATIKTTVNFRE